LTIIFVNYYPDGTMARYLLSSYVLRAYLDVHSKKDYTTKVLNFSVGRNVQKVAQKLLQAEPDVICFSCYVWNIQAVIETVGHIRKEADVAIILGGPEISAESIEALPDPSIVNYYVIGEGERALPPLLRMIDAGQNGKADYLPAGVTFWEDNSLRPYKEGELIGDLDEIPSVYLTEILDDRFYARGQAFLETQRGCPYRCKYCLYHKQRGKTAFYSLDRVFAELRYLIVEKHIKALRIFDSVFTSDLERSKDIVRYLLCLGEEKGVSLPWLFWELRYEDVDEEFIQLVAFLKNRSDIHNYAEVPARDSAQMYSDLLEGYGVVNAIGIQSFHNPSLRQVGRSSINLEQFGRFMSFVRRHNIVLKIDMIFGLPEETIDTFFAGLESLLPHICNSDHILNIHRLAILPGTLLAKQARRKNISYQIEAPHVVLSTDTISKGDLEHTCRLLALLFRVVNSPLRNAFFEALTQTPMPLRDFAESLFAFLEADDDLNSCEFLQDGVICDEYWNGSIFREIPTDWLEDKLGISDGVGGTRSV